MKYLTLFFILCSLSCNRQNPENTTNTLPEDNTEKYELVWSDEFEQLSTPDPEKWNYQTGDGCPEVCGWGNNELQWYTSDKRNVRIEDGKLIIEAHLDNGQYTSARITTKTKGEWDSGRVVVRAALPTGKGTWPAIWMLPGVEKLNWPEDGEIDIMEHVGYNTGTVYGTIHTEKFNHLIGTQKIDSIQVDDVSSFHDYTLEWDKESMTWKVDDETYHVIQRNGEKKDGWPFDNPFYLILNVAVGGNWGGKYGVDTGAFPQQMQVDYVRVYSNNQ